MPFPKIPFADTPDEFLSFQEHDSYAPPPEMRSAFQKLLTDSSVPMSAIAKEAASPIIANMANEQDPRWPDCTLLWRTLCRAVDSFTELNDRFVEFVVELQKLPDGDHVFAILPQFNNHWAEFGYTMTYYVSDEPERDRKHQAQVNHHAFCAKLSTHHQVHPELDQIQRAGFTFRSTCEFAPWERTHFPEIEEWYDPDDDPADFDWPARRDLELERVNIKMLNAKIPAAAQWLQHVGRRLYDMQGNMTGEHDWQTAVLNPKWTGAKGYSKERFVFWRERFEWMTKVTALEKETQKLAQECADKMKEIENGGG
ncbi:hypothetical protein HBI24_226770 [Parastagonospora nodorum]|nr:hypothetical protein HBH53_227040 [Parastagonospora nodorum]KAH3963021.1 hypothetical protein HBH51_170770 [Parastagonospora nodorum]KAH4087787.1 hypothetical protein HBH46_199970 [Parastagonospora nodorum]KAH4112358.1 hypothetical protein HBH47_227100 [Parastagonospora nodorum]KAH4212076.1 hypothetical protein HBI95_049230 [Parastagonospora nodorum]